MKTYDCMNCGGTFEYVNGWTEEDAIAERKNNFPGIPDDQFSVICEDCYQEKMELIR
jgi:rubredoxin